MDEFYDTPIEGPREPKGLIMDRLCADEPPKQVPHYEQRLIRDSNYTGLGSDWTEQQATTALLAALDYFGGGMPAPPCALPGRNGKVDPDAFALLNHGLLYLRSVVERRPGRQWQYHDEVRKAICATYHRGVADERERIWERERQRITIDDTGVDRTSLMQPDSSLVYFIASESGPIKIGKAIDPTKRLRTLQTSHHEKLTILATTDGGGEQEHHYHKRFAAHRLHGEWFARVPEIEAEIAYLEHTKVAA